MEKLRTELFSHNIPQGNPARFWARGFPQSGETDEVICQEIGISPHVIYFLESACTAPTREPSWVHAANCVKHFFASITVGDDLSMLPRNFIARFLSDQDPGLIGALPANSGNCAECLQFVAEAVAGKTATDWQNNVSWSANALMTAHRVLTASRSDWDKKFYFAIWSVIDACVRMYAMLENASVPAMTAAENTLLICAPPLRLKDPLAEDEKQWLEARSKWVTGSRIENPLARTVSRLVASIAFVRACSEVVYTTPALEGVWPIAFEESVLQIVQTLTSQPVMAESAIVY